VLMCIFLLAPRATTLLSTVNSLPLASTLDVYLEVLKTSEVEIYGRQPLNRQTYLSTFF